MTKKSIRSVAFPNAVLRLDGSGLSKKEDPGGGVVNCQDGVGTFEVLDVVSQPDGTVTIGSVRFPNVFLRLDGSGITARTDSGGGHANCQFTAASYEKFRLVPQSNGSFAIASTAFSNVFLRMDGTGVETPMSGGGGVVNGQFGASSWETFRIEEAVEAANSLLQDGEGPLHQTDLQHFGLTRGAQTIDIIASGGEIS
jgi:hypothetical protein